MAYNRNIPQPTDLISNSQPSLLANFQAIDSGTTQTGIGFARNHVTMTDATNGGLHNRIDFYQGIADPTISGWASSLYPKTSTFELIYRVASTNYQLTNLSITTVGGSHGVITPWGIRLNWGKISSVGSGGTALTFPQAFTQIPNVVCTSLNTNSASNATAENISTTAFTAHSSQTNDVCFFAIGF
jgi:hypothetical protein